MEYSLESLIKQAGVLLAQKQYPEAYAIYQQLNELEKTVLPQADDAEVLFDWGMLESGLGLLVPALDKLRKAIAINPRHSACHYHLGRILMQTGRTDDAEWHCLCALSENPSLADAWAVLADIQLKSRRYKDAIISATRATELMPDHVMAHALAARAMLTSGDNPGAIAGYGKVLVLDPDNKHAIHDIAHAYLQSGDTKSAIAALERLLNVDHDHQTAHEELASIYFSNGNPDKAEAVYRLAVKKHPRRIRAHHGLGEMLFLTGKLDEARREFTEILGIDSRNIAARRNLATIAWKLAEPGAALEHCLALLKLDPGEIRHRHNFVQALSASNPAEASADLIGQVIRCFQISGIYLNEIVKPAIRILKSFPGYQSISALTPDNRAINLDAALAGSSCDDFLQQELLHLLLMKTVSTDPDFEILLTSLRRSFLRLSADSAKSSVTGKCKLKLAIALACQCYNNEYVYAQEPGETEAVDNLVQALAVDLTSADFDEAGTYSKIAVACMYRPLYQFSQLVELLDSGALVLPGLFQTLEKRQWRDHLIEAELSGQILSITESDDPVSLAVRNQYEESPYPRWMSAGIYQPEPYDDVIRGMFPNYKAQEDPGAAVHILNAGCGTGRHALLSATRFLNAEVLAVDLSVRSLSYGLRSAQELGITNIDFKQGDILKLGGIGRDFHLIECGGVLHHIKHTDAALKILVSLLRPGGLIMIGLYSRIARQNVHLCSEYLSRLGYGKSVNDVMRARQKIFALETGQPEKRVLQSPDFYSLSGCRDLLFHEHEHTYILPEIREMLQHVGLDFLGFQHGDMQVINDYRQRFPGDPDMTSLENWHAYETLHPRTFARMYNMWCIKT